jgi:hypothetical protein
MNDNDNVITADDERIASAMNALKNGARKVRELSQSYRPPLNGERYMTDKEVSERLKVRRTLQEYRNDRKLPFILFGGKVLYRETDIEKMLEEGYKKAIR